MKIHVIGSRSISTIYGGIEKHCHDLYKIMDTSKYNITLYTISKYEKENKLENIPFIKIKTYFNKFEKIEYMFKSTIKAIKHKPDLIHFHGIPTFAFLAKLFRIKVITTVHSRDYLFPKWGKLARIILKISEFSMLTSDVLITVSKNDYKYYIKKHKNVHYIPNGIDMIDSLKIKEKKYIQNKYNLDLNQDYLLSVGRITPEKQYNLLIEGFKLFNKNKNYNLIICGRNDNGKYSKNILKKIENDEKIIYAGAINNEDLVTFYKNCSLFILSSSHETMPMVILEAANSGAKLLLSNIEANYILPSNKETYFNVNDINDFVNKINVNLDKKNEDFKEYIKQNYLWETIKIKTTNIYDNL